MGTVTVSDPQKPPQTKPRLTSIVTKPEQHSVERRNSHESDITISTLNEDAEFRESLFSPDFHHVGVPQSAIEPESTELIFSPGMAGESASRRSSSETARSSSSDPSVNWEQLAKNEEQEPRDDATDDSTALLLARLEQANNTLAHDPKAKKPELPLKKRGQPRPPSISQLKKLVREPTKPELRYSLLPLPPPMTDLEFYAALVTDYPRTAQSLPTLLSKKIRAGIPPPLRGVVWQSMSGARDGKLEEDYDRFANGTSPFQKLIGKDVGRSFPGVEMFQDPKGEGQMMLSRVLSAFSLYDDQIGYCQGLGFLVGPLVMHMGEKEAFCVLVRLMDFYNLRGSFLPDLPGLHLRIYQFQMLLATNLPTLSAHFDKLQVEPLYPSQWFLSFFAVTCPLPMLLRIYDVIFAEGAAETMMRVALSLMRRNEEKLLALREFEDVMQLLVSRTLWDVYQLDADDFVNDFCGLGNVITAEGLVTLEHEFHHAADPAVKSGSSPGLQAMASKFLGRIWPGASAASARSEGLAPETGNARPTSISLRRTPSKQSIASTLNFSDSQTDSIGGSTRTNATSVTRHGSTDALSLISVSSPPPSATTSKRLQNEKDRDLHGQIEDLLTAFGELQRSNAIQQVVLEKEREDREEDAQAIRALLSRLKLDISAIVDDDGPSDDETINNADEISRPGSRGKDSLEEDILIDDNASTIVITEPMQVSPDESLEAIIERVETRFASRDNRRSSVRSTRRNLRDDLARAKAQLADERAASDRMAQQIGQHEKEINRLNTSLRDTRRHVQESQKQRQTLEASNRELKSKAQASELASGRPDSRVMGGLKELRLGSSSPSQHTFSPRSSSLIFPTNNRHSLVLPNDTLLAELVNARTAEAQAKQEAEEAQGKLESLRKMLGMPSPMTPGSAGRSDSREQPTISEWNGLGKTLSKTVSFPRGGDGAEALGGAATPPAAAAEDGKPAAASEQPVSSHGPSASLSGFASRWTGWGKRSVTSPGLASAPVSVPGPVPSPSAVVPS